MSSSKGIREVGYFDCPGGGQVVVDGTCAYVAHITSPEGTSVVDVSDPKHPRKIAELAIPRGLHSHKVRVANGIMLVNYEIDPLAEDAATKELWRGLGIYDVSDPAHPREITRWTCGGRGVHRFTFDGRYAYVSPEIEGYVGNIVMILDLADPARPVEAGRWWMPGQWVAGGEKPGWKGRAHRCHHPIRDGNRLYVSYWHGGGVILDITDMSAPRPVAHIDWSPPFPWPTHSLVPVPFSIHGHRWMLVADEDVHPLDSDSPREMPAFLWMVNITDETRPVPVGSFQVEGIDGRKQPLETGCHQPVEIIRGNEVPCAWFGQGLRIVDISNPHALREVACYIPDTPRGADRVRSNDVFMDERGLIYLIDRTRGLSIVERV